MIAMTRCSGSKVDFLFLTPRIKRPLWRGRRGRMASSSQSFTDDAEEGYNLVMSAQVRLSHPLPVPQALVAAGF
jgi:hypothetical protein